MMCLCESVNFACVYPVMHQHSVQGIFPDFALCEQGLPPEDAMSPVDGFMVDCILSVLFYFPIYC